MRFEVLDTVSVPGNPEKPNEDAFAHTEQMAVVFDGVTAITEPLMPGKSDPAWLAQFAARRMAAHSGDGGNPRDWIANAAADASKSFTALRRRAPKERYEIPYASLMMVALGDDTLDAFWFGDCAAIVKPPSGGAQVLGDAFQSRLRERAFIAGLAAAEGVSPVAALASSNSKPQLYARRNKFNTSKGPWLFAPDPKCAKHASSARAAIAPVAIVLLASDGLLSLVTDYERYTPEAFVDAALAHGLAPLVEEVRAIEGEDPEGIGHPRFKKSDDATAVLLRVVDRETLGGVSRAA
jgi:hypothetical protein